MDEHDEFIRLEEDVQTFSIHYLRCRDSPSKSGMRSAGFPFCEKFSAVCSCPFGCCSRQSFSRRNWHTPVMRTASASFIVPGLPTELRSIRPCFEGLRLLEAFLRQPESPATAEPQQYRGFRGDPLWRDFTQHWATCIACQQRDPDA